MAENKTHNLGGIEVKIGAGLQADIKKWQNSFKTAAKELEEFHKRATKLADSLDKLAKKLMLGVTTPLTTLAVTSVKTAAEFQAFSNNFNQSFREMSDTVRAWARDFGDAVGRSRLQMETMLSTTQAMLYPMLENRAAAAQMSKAITQLAIDLGSFYDVADEEVLQALNSALVGNTESMRRFGIVVLDSTLELEAQRLGLQKTVSQMSEAEKMLLRYVQILRQTSDAHGDSIRNSQEFGNQLKALQAEFTDLRIEIGERLMPYATALLRWARDFLEALSNLDDETVHTLLNFAVWAASAGVLVWTLSKVIKAVAGVSKALQVLFRLMSTNPWLVLGAIAGGMLLTIDEVQQALEDLARRAGLGGLIDAVEDVTGALGELLDIASELEFDTRPDPTAYIQSLEEARLAAEEMLRQGVGDGIAAGVEDAWAQLEAKAREEWPQWVADLRIGTMMDALMSLDALNWSPRNILDLMSLPAEGLHTMDMALSESQRRLVDELKVRELEIEGYAKRIQELMTEALSIDPQYRPTLDDVVGQEIHRLMTWLLQARGQYYALSRELIYESWQQALSDTGIEAARQAAKLAGQEFDEMQYRLQVTRNALEQIRELNREFGVEYDTGTGAPGEPYYEAYAEYLQWSLEQRRAMQELLLQDRQIYFDTMLTAILRGETDRMSMLQAQAEMVRRTIEARIRSINFDELFYEGSRVARTDRLFDLVEELGIRDLREELRQLEAEIARIELEDKLRAIGDALRESLPGGAAYEVEHLLATLSGQDFDPLEFQILAVSQAIRDQVDAMRQAGLAWDEMAERIAENVAQLQQLSEEWQTARLEERLKAINAELAERREGGALFELERFLAELSGEEFDAIGYQIRAVSQAIWDQIDALRQAGKTWDEIGQAILPLVEDFAVLSEAQWARGRARAVQAVRNRLQQALDVERWVEAAIAGGGFDALQFEADALARAIRDIASEMMAYGASLDAILAETEDLRRRLVDVTAQIEDRQRTTWLARQVEEIQSAAQQWVQSAFALATPAGFLAEILQHLSGYAERLLAPFAIMAEVVGILLEPAFRALFPVLKTFGLIVLTVVQGISTVWNAIVGTLAGIFGALANISILGWKPLGFLKGVADFFKSLMVDTDELSDAMKRLRDLTWDQADAAQAAAEALHNVPSGFKIALRRFQVAEPVPMATGGIVTEPTYALVGEAGPEAVIPLDQLGGGLGGPIVIIQGDVYGWDDFKRKVAQAQGEIRRSASLSRYGMTVGVT